MAVNVCGMDNIPTQDIYRCLAIDEFAETARFHGVKTKRYIVNALP